MRLPTSLLWFVPIGCFLLLALARPAAAQNPIVRCIGADGRPVFTDQPCASMQATSVSTPARAPVDSTSAGPPPVTCAAGYSQLRQSVIDAFAGHDANRLAGLMLWGGYGREAVVADIRSLASVMRYPLVDLAPTEGPPDDAPASAASSDPFASDAPTAPAQAPPESSRQLVLHVAASDAAGGSRELRFDIVRRSGCLWLRNAG